MFVEALDKIGYSYVDVTSDPAYKYFLGNRQVRYEAIAKPRLSEVL